MFRFAFLAAAGALLVSGAAQATVVISSGPAAPLSIDLTSRARWGRNNFEGVILSQSVAVGSTQLNGPGNPAWQLGQAHDFRLTWDASTGTVSWSLDFNRNGSFGNGEVTSYTKPGRVNFSYEFINLSLTSDTQGNGNHSNAIDIGNLSINGTSLGNFSASNGASLSQWFAPTGSSFGNIEVLGTITFRNTNGNGAFAQERPSLNIGFAGLEPIPEPASWAMMIAGFGLVGGMQRRQRLATQAT